MFGVRENSFVLLKALYDTAKGDRQELVSAEKVVKGIGMERAAARAALRYLFDKGLVEDSREMAELPHVFITGTGIDAVEDAVSHPQAATQHFPPVVNILNIQNFNGGAVQQGTVNSTQTYRQTNRTTTVNLRQLSAELSTLRLALLQDAKEPEHYAAIGQIAVAEMAAKESDEPKMQQALSALGSAGRWALDTANKIGVGLATAALKTHLGL